MGRPKALLPDAGGLPFVVRIARTLLEAGIPDVVVVTGALENEMRAALDEHGALPGVRLVRNPDPARGQLSSLHVGMVEAIRPGTEGLMVTLVDIPAVSVATVVQVKDAWLARRAAITRPSIGARHGHPVIFDARLFDALRAAPFDAGAKHVVRAYAALIENVPVDDPGCLLDIDTPDDYARISSPGR
jgi:CTP:molybdopterin cytidylyltransferase MocA